HVLRRLRRSLPTHAPPSPFRQRPPHARCPRFPYPPLFRSPDDFDFVTDRAGRDQRYAIDASTLRDELGWRPRYADFRTGLAATVAWYRDNESWWRPVKAATERAYAEAGERTIAAP